MKVMLVLLAILSVGVAQGCVGPTAEQIASADYGTPITQEAAEASIKEYFGRTLKDPFSAQYKFGEPTKNYTKPGLIANTTPQWGYAVEVQVNAKNSYGGYTGWETYKFLFRDGALLHAWDGKGARVL